MNVQLTPTQVSLFDHLESLTWRREDTRGQKPSGRISPVDDSEEVEDLLMDEEDGDEPAPGGRVVAEWKFGEGA